MKKLILLLIPISMMVSCQQAKDQNPFLTEWDTPFGTPPFHLIQDEHYIPAYNEAIAQNNAEIEAITNNPDEPNFENTIVAFDKSGELMGKIGAVYGGLSSANTSDRMQEIAREITPLLTAHRNAIRFNQDLFERIKVVYDKRESLNLDVEQMRVVEKIYDDFARNGAALPEEQRNELKKLNERMSMVSLNLNQNLLAENNGFKLILDNEADLIGLPSDVIAGAAQAAKSEGHEGKWLFDMSKPSWTPFLQFSERRDLREKILTAYCMRGNNENEFDNKKLFVELMMLRKQMAQILGYNNYAEYFTAEQMAQNPETVFNFLKEVWNPALKRAKEEYTDMQKIIDREGGNFKLQSWDWWYYAEKVRKEKYNLDQEELKPYLTIDNVREGIFYVTNKLYGLTYKKRPDIPVYHEEVQAFEVIDRDGSHLAVLLYDPHPRATKKSGAWCGTYRSGSYKDGNKITPVVTIVTNFSRPVGDKPAMLSWDETETFFHEFGHALHNFFADGQYDRTSRSVPRDYVELPSQVMENWAGEPEVLKVYAKHYQTGEPIPDALIEKMQSSSKFSQGFTNVEYVSAAYLDMAWHTADIPQDMDVNKFETKTMNELGLIDEIVPRYRTTNFGHIFSGGYAAGYYVYLWAGQLDADAFEAFKETGDLFNQELAAKFRKYCLSENAMGEGMEQYIKFRGKAPSIDPLLRQRGLK
ncbi:MAG: M3 family metallopeptidase [Bacteroidales bacterium]|nr:M3 family metallopeptidase [Bacteroidales bacterium]MDY0196315.1 M3 family metallopeptidase [Tenuifilaceae bacterium]